MTDDNVGRVYSRKFRVKTRKVIVNLPTYHSNSRKLRAFLRKIFALGTQFFFSPTKKKKKKKKTNKKKKKKKKK
jgi:hypothetical protein